MKIAVFLGKDPRHPIVDLLRRISEKAEVVVFAKERVEGLPSHEVKLSSYPFFGEELDLSLFSYPSIEKLIGNISPDVILLFGLEKLSLLGLALGKKRGIPVAAYVLKNPFPKEDGWWGKQIEKFLHQYVLEHSDGVIFPTRTLSEKVKGTAKLRKSITLYPPIHPTSKAEGGQRRDIGTGGFSIGPEKNIEEVIEAFPGLANKYKSLRLLIFGEGKHRKQLENIKGKLMLDNVLFKGSLPREEFVKALARLKLYLYPSEEEGFSYSPLEALSAGTPVGFKKGSFLGEILPRELEYSEKGDILGLYERVKKDFQHFQSTAKKAVEKWEEKSKDYFDNLLRFLSTLSAH